VRAVLQWLSDNLKPHATEEGFGPEVGVVVTGARGARARVGVTACNQRVFRTTFGFLSAFGDMTLWNIL